MLRLLFRALLAIWAIGYLIAAGIALVSDISGGGGLGIVALAILFLPWLVVFLILLALAWLTRGHGG